MRKIFIACVVTVLYSAGLYAKEPEAAVSEGLHYTSLVNKFYENNRAPFWFTSSSEIAAAKHGFIGILDSAAWKGLDKAKYHYAEIASDAVATDTNAIKRQDRMFTDAVISFCKDVYQGTDIKNFITSDEISGKYELTDNNYLLTRIGLAKSLPALNELVASLEPSSVEYNALKAELAGQMARNNTLKAKQLKVSLNFYRWIHHFRFDKFIMVNIPEAVLLYYQNDTMRLHMKVVVGKPSTKTPRFSSYCYEVILYPYWNVPTSIVFKELLPKFKRNPAAIDAMNMQVVTKGGAVVNHYALNWANYNSHNFPYGFRQCTGCDNSLGVIKFNLSDPFSVYLHDTNFKKAFSSNNRFLSHGCIRVEKPIELGNFLLNDKLDTAFVKACIANQKPVINKVDKPVPVFVVYLPAATDSVNNIVYLKDIYHLF